MSRRNSNVTGAGGMLGSGSGISKRHSSFKGIGGMMGSAGRSTDHGSGTPPRLSHMHSSNIGWADIFQGQKMLIEEARKVKENKITPSWFLFPESSVFRVLCTTIVNTRLFDNVIVAAILANCVFLALQDPLCNASGEPIEGFESHECNKAMANASNVAELMFSVLFTIEFLLKSVSLGLWMDKMSYLRDSWNWIDFIVVLMGWVSLIPGVDNFTAIRTVRVLRPLRTVSRIGGMRVMVNALITSLVPLGNVLLLCAVIFFIFGIIAMILLIGAFRRRCMVTEGPEAGFILPGSEGQDAFLCSTYTVSVLGGRACPSTYNGYTVSCVTKGLDGSSFSNPVEQAGIINFDNIGSAFLTIFQVITKEGWSTILYQTEDAWSLLGARILFVALIVVGAFFVVNLAIAVISDSFDACSADDRAQTQMRNKWKAAIRQAHALVRRKLPTPVVGAFLNLKSSKVPLKPKASFKRTNSSSSLAFSQSFMKDFMLVLKERCRTLVKQDTFMYAVTGLIILNTITLAMEYHEQDAFAASYVEEGCGTNSECDSRPVGMPLALLQSLEIINYTLTALFSLEAAVKIFGLGWQEYTADNFNNFDLAVVLISLVELAIISSTSAESSGISVFRAFRLFRVLKLARGLPSLRAILDSLQQGMVSLGPLSLILLIFVFMWSLLGMQIFGGSSAFTKDGFRLNFNSFLPSEQGFGAVVTVFQCLTGEAWNEVMYRGYEAASGAGVIVFVALQLIGIYLLLNLFLAILIQGLASAEVEEGAEDKIEKNQQAEKERLALEKLMANSRVILMAFDAKFQSDTLGVSRASPQKSIHRATAASPGEKATELTKALDDLMGVSVTDMQPKKTTVELLNLETLSGVSAKMMAERLGTEPNVTPPLSNHKSRLEEDEDAIDGNQDQFATKFAPDGGVIDMVEQNPFMAGSLNSGSSATAKSFRNRQWKGPTLGLPTLKEEASFRELPVDRTLSNVAEESPSSASASKSLHQSPMPEVSSLQSGSAGVSNVTPKTSLVMQLNGSEQDLMATMDIFTDVIESASAASAPGGKTPSLASASADLNAESADGAVVATGYSRQQAGSNPRSRTPSSKFSPRNSASSRVSVASDLLQEDTIAELGIDPNTPINDVDLRSPASDANRGPAGHSKGGVLSKYFQKKQKQSSKAIIAARKVLAVEDLLALPSKTLLRLATRAHPSLRFRSCGIFEKTHSIRRKAMLIISHPMFDSVILVCICISSILVMIENPRTPQSEALRAIDLLFVGIFTLEMLIKVLALGFVAHEGSYLRSAFNQLDFLIVLIPYFSLILESQGTSSGGGLSALRALRTFRALRPLRLIQRNQAMKISLMCLVRSIPSIFNVMLVAGLIFLVFSILGVQLFKGSFFFCADSEGSAITAQVNDMIDCANANGTWVNRDQTFDNVGAAVLTLFEVSTLEGWIEIMEYASDSRGPGLNPKLNSSPVSALFFITFIVIGSFVMLNLFIGVVIENYNKIKSENNGEAFLSSSQMAWVEAQKHIMRLKPPKILKRPKTYARARVFDIVMKPKFELSILAIVGLNLIIMASQFYGMPDSWAFTLSIANLIITAIFLAEVFLKIFGLGFGQYFRSGWNIFDFSVTALSVVGLVLESSISLESGDQFGIFRVFRVGRLLRLVRSFKSLRRLFETLLFSAPSLVNVGSLLVLLLTVYAVLGVNFFFNVKHGDFIDYHANFETFDRAIFVLLRVSTGEDWNGLMHDTARGLCLDPAFENGCGSPVTAYIFFISFNFVCTFVLLNLFIAVIMDNFQESEPDESKSLTKENLEEFAKSWAKFDPDGEGVMHIRCLTELLLDLPKPLGLKGQLNTIDLPRTRVMQRIKDLDCICVEGKVHYLHLLQNLAEQIAGVEIPTGTAVTEELTNKRQILKKQIGKKIYSSGTRDAQLLCVAYAGLVFSRFAENRKQRRLERATALVGDSAGAESVIGELGTAAYDAAFHQDTPGSSLSHVHTLGGVDAFCVRSSSAPVKDAARNIAAFAGISEDSSSQSGTGNNNSHIPPGFLGQGIQHGSEKSMNTAHKSESTVTGVAPAGSLGGAAGNLTAGSLQPHQAIYKVKKMGASSLDAVKCLDGADSVLLNHGTVFVTQHSGQRPSERDGRWRTPTANTAIIESAKSLDDAVSESVSRILGKTVGVPLMAPPDSFEIPLPGSINEASAAAPELGSSNASGVRYYRSGSSFA